MTYLVVLIARRLFQNFIKISDKNILKRILYIFLFEKLFTLHDTNKDKLKDLEKQSFKGKKKIVILK